MNNPPSHPRFYCRLVRLWSTTGQSSSHAESCAECRQYFRAADKLESALRRDAVRFAPPAPAGLEQGIMQAIRAATPVRSRAPSSVGWFAGAGVAAAAAVALAVVLLQHPPQGQTAVVATNPATPETVSAPDSISDQLYDKVISPAGTLVANNPLQHELDSVYSDTRSALNFLALNFLPSSSNLAARAGQIGAKG